MAELAALLPAFTRFGATPPVARAMSDWERWFAAGQAGDAAAYRCFLEAAAGHVRRQLARRAGPGEVDDLVQETLLAVHAKRHTYDPALPLVPWLNGIARYKWIDWLRRRGRQPTTPLEVEPVDEREHDPAAGHAVGLLLEEIPPKQAQAIRLVKLEGHSVEEAARISGQSVPLIKVNVHRGLKRLSALVAGRDEEG